MEALRLWSLETYLCHPRKLEAKLWDKHANTDCILIVSWQHHLLRIHQTRRPTLTTAGSTSSDELRFALAQARPVGKACPGVSLGWQHSHI